MSFPRGVALLSPRQAERHLQLFSTKPTHNLTPRGTLAWRPGLARPGTYTGWFSNAPAQLGRGLSEFDAFMQGAAPFAVGKN